MGWVQVPAPGLSVPTCAMGARGYASQVLPAGTVRTQAGPSLDSESLDSETDPLGRFALG